MLLLIHVEIHYHKKVTRIGRSLHWNNVELLNEELLKDGNKTWGGNDTQSGLTGHTRRGISHGAEAASAIPQTRPRWLLVYLHDSTGGLGASIRPQHVYERGYNNTYALPRFWRWEREWNNPGMDGTFLSPAFRSVLPPLASLLVVSH